MEQREELEHLHQEWFSAMEEDEHANLCHENEVLEERKWKRSETLQR